jgi:hypothetical protein
MAISSGRTTFEARVLNANCAFDPAKKDDGDYGYLELSKDQAGTIEAQGKVFVNYQRLHVATPQKLEEEDDWMVVAGYPYSLISGGSTAVQGVRLLTYGSILAGKGAAPSAPVPPSASNLETVDLWIPRSGNINSLTGKYERIDVPSLAGASGGGCWKTGIRPTPANWAEERLRLAAIHRGSTVAVRDVKGEAHVFAREILIGHHLRLVAADYPELRSAIFDSWPWLSGRSDG